jgi:uncharacterized protein (DUF1800 family)
MFTRFLAIASAVAVCAGTGDSALKAAGASPDDAAIVHVLNRVTYGPRRGDVDRVRAMGLQNFIEQQLTPGRIDDHALDARLQRLETLALDSQTIQRDYEAPARMERRERQRQKPEADTDPQDPAMRRAPPSGAQKKAREVITDLSEAKLLRAVYSDRQLEEVLVDFWFNHFNVFAGKGATRSYITEYEREAIRPYVLGRFRDMLGATAKHPAMLFYLDNWQSKADGINENYARELLELHTLGVDGGYTQQDIVNVARAFTGWTMQPRTGSGFRFAPARHDRGAKVVLGHTIKAGGGAEDGEKVLDIVAMHPATAHHIALQLATRFVSDTPPPALVDRAAARFLASNGDLREVTKLILTSPEFLSPDAYRVKVKTPFEFVASALRATGADVKNAMPLARTLQEMGMQLYFCQPPTGYDEVASTWVSAGALVSRMNFAVDLSKNAVRGVRVPLSEEQTAALKIGAPEFQRQ